MDNVNLICFPYAGGSKYAYLRFESVAPKGLNIITMELPGRGDRLLEPLLVDVNSMVDDLFISLKDNIYKPYIIYGHSMGAILGYLIAKKLQENNFPLPLHLIITGCEGPASKNENQKKRSQLPPDEFIEELKTLGGIPDQVFEDISFQNFFEPILRADFKALEDYKYSKGDPLNVPICVLFGEEENFSLTEALLWKEESNCEVEVIQFPGDHFFIFKHVKQIMNIIQKKIQVAY